ncbi:MAG TPA: metallophosphoesterase [Thermoanaerobaculia bacterium]|nr:metallophosphoesterase [Thermoanaerobaculia bacterium]
MSWVFFLIVAAFALFNFVTIRSLLAFHPRWRSLIIVTAVAGNLVWPLLPFILSARTNPYIRLVRATLGPIWFSWLIVVFVYSAFVAIMSIIWIVAARRRRFVDFSRRSSIAWLAVLVLLALIGVYHALVPLRVERVTVAIRNLDPQLVGYRVALLSDLHVGLFTRPSRLTRTAETVRAERPAIVAIAGDFIDDDPFFVPKLLKGLSSIPSDIPIVAALGNHEMYGNPEEVIRGMAGSRVELLVNRGKEVGRGSAKLWVAGLSDFAAAAGGRRARPGLAPDLDKAMAGSAPNAPTILLAHQPDAFTLARRRGIALTIAGHTHGGQFGIRAIRWSLAGVFLPFDMGLYRREDSQLYITTGAGYWLVPFRLGMSPEVVILTLTPSN